MLIIKLLIDCFPIPVYSDVGTAAFKQRGVPDSVRDGGGISVHIGIRGRLAVHAIHAAAPHATHPSQHHSSPLLPDHLHLRRHMLLFHNTRRSRYRCRLHRHRSPCILHLHRLEKQTPMVDLSVQFLQPRMLQNIPLSSRKFQGFMIFTLHVLCMYLYVFSVI